MKNPLVRFFTWASCRRRRWFPWVFIRRREFDLLAAGVARSDKWADLVQTFQTEGQTNRRELAEATEELRRNRLLFDQLVMLVPRLSGAKANAVTLFMPRAVVEALRKSGPVVVQEFAKELGRRLVTRAIRELLDNPPESANLPK